MFSPYYAWSRRRFGDAGALPEAHCAINLSLYRRAPGTSRFQRLWAMTERGARQLQRNAQHLRVGPSRLAWGPDGSLHVDIDETTAPWPQRLRGRIHLTPQLMPAQDFALDAAGRHSWQPISPRARVALDFNAPALRWQGEAYLDANHGTRPLERDFHSWHWQRSALPGHRSEVLYEAQALDGSVRALSLHLSADGQLQPQALPPSQALPRSAWGIARHTRAHTPLELLATLESGPFYCRSLLRDPGNGALAVHESLSLQRFRQPWVQAILPFRMPRWATGH